MVKLLSGIHLFLLLEGTLYHSIHGAVDVGSIEDDDGARGAEAWRYRDRDANPCCGFTQCHSILRQRRGMCHGSGHFGI